MKTANAPDKPVVGVLVQQFLIRRVLGLNDLPQIFLTFALSLLILNLALMLLTANYRTVHTWYSDEALHIGGLYIPVDDVLGVRHIQTIGNLGADGEQSFQFQRTPADAVFQGLAIQKLHHDEPLSIVTGNLVDGADIGMAQRRGGPSFTPKALQRLRIVGDVVGQKLQGHKPAEHEVLGLVHHTHASATQLFQDTIVRNGLTDHGGPTLWRDVRSRTKASQSGVRFAAGPVPFRADNV